MEIGKDFFGVVKKQICNCSLGLNLSTDVESILKMPMRQAAYTIAVDRVVGHGIPGMDISGDTAVPPLPHEVPSLPHANKRRQENCGQIPRHRKKW